MEKKKKKKTPTGVLPRPSTVGSARLELSRARIPAIRWTEKILHGALIGGSDELCSSFASRTQGAKAGHHGFAWPTSTRPSFPGEKGTIPDFIRPTLAVGIRLRGSGAMRCYPRVSSPSCCCQRTGKKPVKLKLARNTRSETLFRRIIPTAAAPDFSGGPEAGARCKRAIPRAGASKWLV